MPLRQRHHAVRELHAHLRPSARPSAESARRGRRGDEPGDRADPGAAEQYRGDAQHRPSAPGGRRPDLARPEQPRSHEAARWHGPTRERDLMNKYLLVDGNNIASRAAHASWSATSLSTVDGVPTAALMIFANSIIKMIAEEQPTHMGVAWDGKSKHRLSLLPTYKANRKEAPDEDVKVTAFTMMKAFLQACGIPNVIDKDFEADDILAGWWWDIFEASEIVIATGDKDLFQLLGQSPQGCLTTIRRPAGNGVTEHWTAERFEEEYGYPVQYWSAVTALTGDTSDNIDGIRGIGPKKAV